MWLPIRKEGGLSCPSSFWMVEDKKSASCSHITQGVKNKIGWLTKVLQNMTSSRDLDLRPDRCTTKRPESKASRGIGFG